MYMKVWNLSAWVLLATVMSVKSQVNPFNINQLFTKTKKIEAEDDRLWLFSVDGLRRPFGYLTEDGTLTGFHIDFINLVCAAASKKCDTILMPFTECTFTDRGINYPGRGIMAEWFDGCPGYGITLDRQNVFDFTLPFFNTDASFTVLPGNPKKFDPTADDFTNFTLVHLTGASTNEKCLNRLGKKFKDMIVAVDLPDAKDILMSGKADVLFSPRNKIPGLDVLPDRFHCDVSGAGIMVKKGSTLPSWWNEAFTRLYESGDFKRFCDRQQNKYNFTFNCVTKRGSTKFERPNLSNILSYKKGVVWMYV